jgi:hypothetical protein
MIATGNHWNFGCAARSTTPGSVLWLFLFRNEKIARPGVRWAIW